MAGRWDGYVKKQKPCSNENCTTLVWKGKYCGKCKKRLRVHGDVNKVSNKRKLQYNENFIEVQNKESCWFIGWVASDGYIYENGSSKAVRIQICDLDILENFARLIGYNGTIKSSNKNILDGTGTKIAYRLVLSNKKMVSDFVKLGIRQKKSLTLEMPPIEPEFFYHFFRGVIEGDGSVVREKEDRKRLFIFLNSASVKFLEQCAEKIGLPYKIREMKPGVSRLVYWGKHAEELASRIYKDSEGIRLTRKYEVYKRGLENAN